MTDDMPQIYKQHCRKVEARLLTEKNINSVSKWIECKVPYLTVEMTEMGLIIKGDEFCFVAFYGEYITYEPYAYHFPLTSYNAYRFSKYFRKCRRNT